jgi:DNA-binding beta-propeller fold protein YncE
VLPAVAVRLTLAASLALLAGLLPAAGGRSLPTGGGERAFVAAEGDAQLIAVDLGAAGPGGHEIVARLKVPDGPHNVDAGRFDRFVLATSPPAGKVTLVDSYGPRILKIFSGLAYPHDVELGRSGQYAYVTEEHGNAIAVLDVARLRIVRRVPVPDRPHDLALSRSGGRVWVTHGPRASRVTVLDTTRPAHARVVHTVAASGPAHDIAFGCGGRRVWLTYWGSGTIGALDSRTGRLVLRKRLGSLIHHVQSTSRPRVIWATDHAGDRALMLDGCSGRVLRTLRVGRSPHHVATGLFRGHVVVASHDDDSITIFDPVSERASSLRVGDGPHGVAIAAVP